MTGHFITFEGGEGAGKTTQIKRLAAKLRGRGIDVLETREPGGSPGAEDIRKLLVSGESQRWDGVTEALLHFAARRDHLRTTIWPALKKGQWVLCDRFADSTMAYQGHAHGLGTGFVSDLYKMVVGDFRPNLTLLLDLPVEIGLKRAIGRGGDENRYEKLGPAFHEMLRQGFLSIAKGEPERIRLIDANQSVELIENAVWTEVAQTFKLAA